MKKMLYVLLIFAFNTTVVLGTAITPKATNVNIWEPFYWQVNGAPGDQLLSKLSQEGNYWTLSRCYDDTPYDYIGTCTRYNADHLSDDSYITLVNTHGGTGSFTIATTENYNTAVSWANSSPGLYVSGPGYYGGFNVYSVVANNIYLSNYWTNNHINNNSIVFLGFCHSGQLMNCVGGETVFGYDPYNEIVALPTFQTEITADIVSMFERMNGTDGTNGAYRIASDAYTNYTNYYSTNLLMNGGDSTLAPTTLDVYPYQSGAGQSGTGYILFDSIMDTTIAATDALSWSCSPYGYCKVTNIHWDTANKNRIYFNYSGRSGYTIQMTANSPYCLSETSNIQLNGDGVNGVGDSTVWQFSY